MKQQARALGKNLRNLRARAGGVTLVALAEATGLSRKIIASIEQGSEAPSLEQVCLLAHGLGCTPADLLQDVEPLAAGGTDSRRPYLRGFRPCSRCYVPTKGSRLRELLEHLEEAHGVAKSEFARACGLKESSILQYFYREELHRKFQKRLSDLMRKSPLLVPENDAAEDLGPAEEVEASEEPDPTEEVEAIYPPLGCPECHKNIRAGSGLVGLLKHFWDVHGIGAEAIAEGCDVQPETLRQYRYRASLPVTFQESLKLFVRRKGKPSPKKSDAGGKRAMPW
ncbi:MAG: helix-turn-helix domain-containing protein [Planctomycetota bacterium]